MTPRRATDPAEWPAILALLHQAFAEMDGRIDPPSSLHDLTPAGLTRQATLGEIWVIGTPPVACLFLTPRPGALYLGKLAVAASHRGTGLARQLLALAETRARALHLPALELQTRIELTRNHANFRALGFTETGRTAHPGYDRPTSITFRRPLPMIDPTTAAWLNPPPDWQLADSLSLTTAPKTDFWRDTLYGFRRASGHAFLAAAPADFTLHLTFQGDYQALYDQAGLLLWQDEGHWLKAGVELSDGVANLSVVVTDGASDWSTQPLAGAAGSQRLRLTRRDKAVVVQVRNPANRWQLLRVAPFPAGPARIGPMACSPEGPGFAARFTEFRLGPPVAQPLHDESPAD